jgi:transposase-like protein
MTSVFDGFRFPPEVISLAVRWYLRSGPSYRDVEELKMRGCARRPARLRDARPSRRRAA